MFKKDQKIPELNLVLDIGTEFVKSILFKVDDDVVYITKTAKVRQSTASMKSGVVSNIRNVLKTCQNALDLLEVKVENINQTFIGIAGELVKGIPVEIEYIRKNPQKEIDQSEISNIIEKIKDETYEEAQKHFFMSTGDENEGAIRLIETAITDCEIDGFRVEEPIGLSGQKINLKVFFTYAPILHIGYLNSIAKELGLKIGSIVAEPFAVAHSIHGRKENDYSAIIIDIGGGTSDIALIKNGVMIGTQMLSFGGRVFTKRISKNLNIPLDEAEDIKLKYSSRELTMSKIPHIKSIIGLDVELWVDGIEIMLEELIDEAKSFPNQILICGGGSLLPEIKDALIEHPWTQILPFNRAPKVSFLMPQDLRLIKDETGKLNGSDDITPLSIARFGADKLSKI